MATGFEYIGFASIDHGDRLNTGVVMPGYVVTRAALVPM
jgi:hypothetical protein